MFVNIVFLLFKYNNFFIFLKIFDTRGFRKTNIETFIHLPEAINFNIICLWTMAQSDIIENLISDMWKSHYWLRDREFSIHVTLSKEKHSLRLRVYAICKIPLSTHDHIERFILVLWTLNKFIELFHVEFLILMMKSNISTVQRIEPNECFTLKINTK